MTRVQGGSFCGRCGAPFQSGQAFCAGCGVALGRGSPVASGSSRRGVSASRVGLGTVILGGILAVLVVWFFFPGVFDSQSESIFGSKNRRSPLADAVGPRILANKEVVVGEDHYQRFDVHLKVRSTLSIDVTLREGPKFEMFVMDREGYEEFDKAAGKILGGRFHHYSALSSIVGKTVHKKGALPAGRYVVLLDNTDFGDVAPPMNFSSDDVRAQIKIVAE